MSQYELWTLILLAGIAVCLFCIIIIALFGNYIKQKILPAKLNLEVLDKNGELTILDNGHRVIYYHLRVINPGIIPVKNCRVILKKIMKLHENGLFINVPISVPPRYIWSPSETSPEGVDIVNERIADFGYIIDSSHEFKPTVTPLLNSFKGNLGRHETFRYYIEMIAENYRPKKLITIEVTWDGLWPDNLNDMHMHLKIIKVS